MHRAALVVCMLANVASAQPRVEVEATGECPSSEQVKMALAAWLPGEGAEPAWRLQITRSDAAASLVLRDAGGSVVARRQVASADCRAVADAFAVMVHGQFVELKLIDRGVAVPKKREVRAVVVGAAGGVDVSSSAAVFGQVDAAVGLVGGLRVRAVAALDSGIVVANAMDRVDLMRASGRVEVAWRARLGGGWVQPAVGVGAAAWRVDPLDLAAATIWRLQPIADAGVGIGFPVGSRVALRVELVGTLFLVRHRYLVDPGGEVGSSPRAALTTGAGLEWRLR